MKSLMLAYAMTFIGVPYRWGGNNPLEGFDCSGYVQEVLASIGIDPPGDQTAQALYDMLCEKGWRSQLGEGAILFFGESRQHITHVAIAVNHDQMIEAGGGDSKVKTKLEAMKRGAFVRIRPLRKDLVAVLKPD